MTKDLYDEYTIQEVFKLVIEGEKIISQAKGKDLILFVGKTQVGKSTTINSLLGVNFKYSGNRVAADPPESILAPIGDVKNGGVSCTIYPRVYISENSDKCYLDTQGFFDNRRNKVIIIASKIIMQMAINQAKSVRAVVLCNYYDIEVGLAEYDKLGEELSNFFKSDNAPVYFLINRFYSRELFTQNFISWPEEKQFQMIKQKIEEHSNYIITGGENLKKQSLRRIKKKAEKLGLITKEKSRKDQIDQNEFNALTENKEIQSIMEQDPEYKKIHNQILYISLFKNNYKKGYYGYIDPTSKNSVQHFLNDISKLPAINTQYLVFNEGNSERSYFDNIFRSKINKDIDFMKQLRFAKLYPEDQIDQLIEQINISIEQKQKIMTQIENKEINEESLNQLLIEYTEETQSQIQQMKQAIEKLKQKKNNDEQKKQDFLNQEPIEVFRDPFIESAGFSWYATHHTVYDKNIPFCKFTEKLSKHTKRDHVNCIDQSNATFDVVYTTAKKAHDIVPFVPVANIVAVPIFCLASKDCKGDIRIYAHPQDAEPEQYQSMIKEIENDYEQIGQLSGKLEYLKSQGESGISVKLSSLIDCLKTNLNKLKIIKDHVHEVMTVCNTEVKEIEKSEIKKVDENGSEEEEENDDDDDDDSNRNDEPIIEIKIKMTRIEEIESHKGIIDLLYKDDLQNPTLNEFARLFRNIKNESIAEREIQVDSLIAEGNLIFHLNK